MKSSSENHASREEEKERRTKETLITSWHAFFYSKNFFSHMIKKTFSYLLNQTFYRSSLNFRTLERKLGGALNASKPPVGQRPSYLSSFKAHLVVGPKGH